MNLFSYEKIFLDDRKYDARFAMDISQGVSWSVDVDSEEEKKNGEKKLFFRIKKIY